MPRDPRWLQLFFLASFLAFGLSARDFPVWHAPLLFAACLGTQALCARLLRVETNGWPSPVITAFGLTLLLRSDAAWVPLFAAAVAIGSKFFVRVRGRHFLNPANAGVCAAMLVSPHAWCSPAQWGQSAVFLLWILALGLAVAHRAFRSDTSLAFLAAHLALKAARVGWLGQPRAVFVHQLESGSLLLFAFFMISDPKTTPQRRPLRIVYAAAVAATAFALQLRSIDNPLLWALLACAPLTPLFDRLSSNQSTGKEMLPCASLSPLPSVS